MRTILFAAVVSMFVLPTAFAQSAPVTKPSGLVFESLVDGKGDWERLTVTYSDLHPLHGGLKLSGIGREMGRYGIEEYLEYQSLIS